jgi:hypothetical protein
MSARLVHAIALDTDGERQCLAARATAAHHTRRKMTVPFVPPKPNEFDSAASILSWRAACGT